VCTQLCVSLRLFLCACLKGNTTNQRKREMIYKQREVFSAHAINYWPNEPSSTAKLREEKKEIVTHRKSKSQKGASAFAAPPSQSLAC